MTLMAAHAEHDARGTARVLATTALRCLREPDEAPEREVTLNNVYRLLQAVRTNHFFGVKSAARDCSYAPSEPTLVPDTEMYVSDVRDAVEAAWTTVFSGQTKEQAFDTIERVLRSVTYPTRFPKAPAPEESAAVTQFFDQFAERLYKTGVE